MKQVQAYVGIARRGQRARSWPTSRPTACRLYQQLVAQPVHLDYRVNHTRWVVLRYPTPSMAQMANMSTEAFEDFFFRVCTLDYARMAPGDGAAGRAHGAHRPGAARGPRHRPALQHQGHRRGAVRGPAQHPGRRVLHRAGARLGRGRDHLQHAVALPGHHVRRTCRSRSRRAASSRPPAIRKERLEALLDTDEGARYVGEFSLGFNPHILQPDEGHAVRREDRRLAALHARPGLQHRRQRQPLAGALGPGADPASRVRRRRGLVRRRAGPQGRTIRGAGPGGAEPREPGS